MANSYCYAFYIYPNFSIFRFQQAKTQRNGNFMNSAAMVIMLLAQGIVISFAAYLFYRVLTTSTKPEPDSYSDNDRLMIGQKD
ncbi:hypothetical protein DHD32_16925 [Arenibacter sp. TNZ]|nr:hypothetical protein [Arenibacter sp. TNZ]